MWVFFHMSEGKCGMQRKLDWKGSMYDYYFARSLKTLAWKECMSDSKNVNVNEKLNVKG